MVFTSNLDFTEDDDVLFDNDSEHSIANELITSQQQGSSQSPSPPMSIKKLAKRRSTIVFSMEQQMDRQI